MELKVVPIKKFKRIFYNFLLVCLLVLAGGILLFKLDIQLFPQLLWALSIQNVLLYVLAGALLIGGFLFIMNKSKIKKQDDFESKLIHFEKTYTRRLWWHVISISITILFLLLTMHVLFLYFAVFDMLSVLSIYPGKELITRDMNEEEIIFN